MDRSGETSGVSRYLCSELIVLRREGAETVVNLEEIWIEGAAVEMDEPLAAGLAVELQCGEHLFTATVARAEKHELGCRIELEFSRETPWDPAVYKPTHLMNPADLPGENRSGAN